MQSAMHTHLDQTLTEATHRLKGDYAADVKDYDAIEQHILNLADTLSDGYGTASVLFLVATAVLRIAVGLRVRHRCRS